ncbi:NUDIX hydrolase [Nannocystis pusilla]|uniref:NUDIX hydrolase n=1 Tax=Nannocystis pusilla TaxID=889268 RepID=UPI003B79E2E1
MLAPILVEETPGDGPRLLLIERAGNLRSHPGQLAFPGGKPDPEDADLVATALREAWEEVALPPGRVTVIGRLNPVPVPTGYVIIPFVGLVDGPFVPTHAEAEVTAVLMPSLRRVSDPAIYRFAGEREWQGQRYELHEFQIHEPPLWGATARIVYDLYKGSTSRPPARQRRRETICPESQARGRQRATRRPSGQRTSRRPGRAITCPSRQP